MKRVQIDLIDMRHSSDGEFNWIGHFTDHMSKFHILFPCKNKSAPEVAKLIEERVLASLGPPHIFHSDNGREFVNNLLHSLLDNWSSGNVTFVTGRPRHSQPQGLVERGNAIIEDKIAAIKTLKSPLGWLTDNHMFLVNYVLKKEYPCAKGLQDTLLQQILSWDVPTGEFFQILHTEGNTG